MKLRNQATILIVDQIDTVKATFEKHIEGLSKTYTYKCKKGDLVAGDQVIVIANDQYKMVTIVSVDSTPDIDPHSTYEYAWIVQKLDLTQYNKALEAEETLMAYLKEATRKKLIREVSETLKEDLPKEALTVTTL